MERRIYIIDFGDSLMVGQSSNVSETLHKAEAGLGQRAKHVFSLRGDERIEQSLKRRLHSFATSDSSTYTCRFDLAKQALLASINSCGWFTIST